MYHVCVAHVYHNLQYDMHILLYIVSISFVSNFFGPVWSIVVEPRIKFQ